MKIFLFVFMIVVLYGRENPFVPVVVNINQNIVKENYFKQIKTSLPSDARILKSVTFTYQTLSGAIKSTTVSIDKHIDWHNPLYVSANKIQKKKITKIKVGFVSFYIEKNKILVNRSNKLIRHFMLVSPFRYVMDFRANMNFLTYKKDVKHCFVKRIIIGNHNGFYRVVLYLDGAYKPLVKKTEEGYLVEFK